MRCIFSAATQAPDEFSGVGAGAGVKSEGKGEGDSLPSLRVGSGVRKSLHYPLPNDLPPKDLKHSDAPRWTAPYVISFYC